MNAKAPHLANRPYRIAGVIDGKSDIGQVVAIQGNYGQSFVWSEDGLFVTALF